MSFIEDRLEICEHCSIYNKNSKVCQASLWINPETNVCSTEPFEGAYKGCGCYIPSKITKEYNKCPAKKW